MASGYLTTTGVDLSTIFVPGTNPTLSGYLTKTGVDLSTIFATGGGSSVVTGYLTQTGLDISSMYATYLVASTKTVTITGAQDVSYNFSKTITPSFNNINIKFDVLYQGGTELFTLQSSTDINLQYNIQIEGYVDAGYLGLGLYYVSSPKVYLVVNTKQIGDGAWHTVNIIITNATLVVKIDTASDYTYTGNKGLYTAPGYILNKFVVGMNFGYVVPAGKTNSYRNIYIY